MEQTAGFSRWMCKGGQHIVLQDSEGIGVHSAGSTKENGRHFKRIYEVGVCVHHAPA
jgi:hypothetical protein